MSSSTAKRSTSLQLGIKISSLDLSPWPVLCCAGQGVLGAALADNAAVTLGAPADKFTICVHDLIARALAQSRPA